MQQSGDLTSLSPAELRLLIRQNDSRISTTTGLAYGKSNHSSDLWHRCENVDHLNQGLNY